MSMTSHTLVGALCFGLGVILSEPVKKGARWAKDKATDNKVVKVVREGYRRGKERVMRHASPAGAEEQEILAEHGIQVEELDLSPVQKWE